jgi:hypothetical protein
MLIADHGTRIRLEQHRHSRLHPLLRLLLALHHRDPHLPEMAGRQGHLLRLLQPVSQDEGGEGGGVREDRECLGDSKS